jgi:cellulose biosynthesis protein BcsQ
VPTLPVQAEVANDTAVPRLPTTVVSSWKGGVWKTCISASLSERLAFAGLDVLYLVTDDQLDARRRLGISESDPDVARVQRGPGSITVVGLAGAHAVDVLYRSGPARFRRFDATVVDTPPVKKGGCLPGVLLIAPTGR